jgi:hypothetical protein
MQIVFLIGLGSFVLSLCHCLYRFKFCNVHLISCMSFSLSDLSCYIFLIISSEFHICLCALQCLYTLCVPVHCSASIHFVFLYTAVPPYTLRSCAVQCLHTLCVPLHCSASIHFAFLYTAVPPYTLRSCTLQCLHTVCDPVHCSISIQHTASSPCSFLFLSKLLHYDWDLLLSICTFTWHYAVSSVL